MWVLRKFKDFNLVVSTIKMILTNKRRSSLNLKSLNWFWKISEDKLKRQLFQKENTPKNSQSNHLKKQKTLLVLGKFYLYLITNFITSLKKYNLNTIEMEPGQHMLDNMTWKISFKNSGQLLRISHPVKEWIWLYLLTLIQDLVNTLQNHKIFLIKGLQLQEEKVQESKCFKILKELQVLKSNFDIFWVFGKYHLVFNKF